MKFAVFALIASFSLVAVTGIATEELKRVEYEIGLIKDVKCALNKVWEIKSVAEEFNSDIKGCKGVIDERVENLIKSLDEFIKISVEALTILKDDCKGGEHIGLICVNKISVKLIQLMAKAADLGQIILDIRNVPGEIDACILDAVHEIGDYFIELPADIKTCF